MHGVQFFQSRRQDEDVKAEDSNYRLGSWLALLAAAGFSGKAIFVKLAYGVAPVDAVTLLALRLLYALPVFIWVAFDTQR